MRTVVLDDDPTGTQSATDVTVVFDPDIDVLRDVLATENCVYVQTNSRAVDAPTAVARVRAASAAARVVGASEGARIRVVMRGDSTLRGHVFPEIDEVSQPDDVVVFAPAFPAGGRVTINGVHYVQRGQVRVPAAQTEYADDPVFPFAHSDLVAYVSEKSDRRGRSVPLDDVRSGLFAARLLEAAPGEVVIPDIVTDADVRDVAIGIEHAMAEGLAVAVRGASPLAAVLAGVQSTQMLSSPVAAPGARALIVCGSHTEGATEQLEGLAGSAAPPVIVDTDAAMRDSERESDRVVAAAVEILTRGEIPIMATERIRRPEHNTLAHGEAVMTALVRATERLLPYVDVVISKGGITASEVASAAIGARRARVRGQILPGVSVWQMRARNGDEILQVIVPGNVGERNTLREAVRLVLGPVGESS